MKTTITITALILSLCFAGNCSDDPKETTSKHQCSFIACDYVGLGELPEIYNPIDSIHFYNPSLSYDSVESIVLINGL